MAQMFTLSDSESEDQEDSPQTKQRLTAPLQKGQLLKQRNHSVNEEDLLETGTGEDEYAFQKRSFQTSVSLCSSSLWAAKKYGQQLRRMSDEFDILLGDKEMKRVRSAGSTRQMHPSRSWFAFLWSHKESDAESRPAG